MIYLCLQFEKPGRRENFDYPDMAKEAVTKALKDAKIDYKEVKQATVGFCYGKFHSYINCIDFYDILKLPFQANRALVNELFIRWE